MNQHSLRNPKVRSGKRNISDIVRQTERAEERLLNDPPPAVWSIPDLLDAIERRMNDRSRSELAAELGLPDYEVRHLVRLVRRLHPEVRAKLELQDLSFGHARTLARLNADDQPEMMANLFRFSWSVRQLEAQVRSTITGDPLKEEPDAADFHRFAEAISQRIGHPVKITPEPGSGKGGTLTLRYADLDDLDALLANAFHLSTDDLLDD